MKYRLDKNCTNNQAEQIAILKALDKLKESNLDNQEKTAALYTDSLITLDSLKNMNNHNAIIKGIRSSLRTLEAEGWNIQYSWVTRGNTRQRTSRPLANKQRRTKTFKYVTAGYP